VLRKVLQGSDDAFVMTTASRQKKHDVECYNCHKRGHMKADCWAKGGGKEGQGPRRSDGAAARTSSSMSAQEADIEAWAAIEELPDEDIDQDELHQVMAADSIRASKPEAELYDSGASRHMSPYRHRFKTYRTITPWAIVAAGERTFYGVGTGDLKIEVPRGESHSVVLLRDVLHAPYIVSIARIAKARHTVSFKGGSCNITGLGGRTIVTIPANANGLYKWNTT
jgi:hypothetical protein